MLKKRLLILARCLEKIQREQPETFDIALLGSKWTYSTFIAGPLGHAARIPAFKRKGLSLIAHTSLEFSDSRPGVYRVWFNGLYGLPAAQAFFLTDATEARRLFTPKGYVGRVQAGDVARKIRLFVEKKNAFEHRP